jgi:branched-chain amino acid transport system ATP-binding protein
MISVRGIFKSFGGIHAVDDCSFDVATGSITGLIGPNGAGKTTLFNIVAGFFKADAGTVIFDDQDVTGLEPHELFDLGLVRTFQIPHEFSRMTVLENLSVVPGQQTGESLLRAWTSWSRIKEEERNVRRRAEETLDFLNLTHMREELAGNLSGGQKKLLELGRAMMSGAKTILLDEPGAGVNRTLLASLSDGIQRLNREQGYTFCIVEHDMDLIAKLCDPVVVMAEGKVMTQGTMAEIRENPEVIEAYFGGGGNSSAAGVASAGVTSE